MEIPGIDPSLLNKPLEELALPNTQKDEGIQVKNADALLPKEDTTSVTTTVPDSDEEGKVPYRRFKKFHERALEAEREAEFWKNRAMEVQTRPIERDYYQPPAPNQYIEPTFQGPDWERFKALFAGADENAVKEAYRLEVQRIAAVEERAVQRAEETFNQRSEMQRQEFRGNRDYLDEWTDEASDLAGRSLTEEEQIALLDVMDEFSPKNDEGKIESPITPQQALRIYQMQNSAHSQRRETRDALARASSASSGGETSVAVTPKENNQQFNAQLGWRANFRRLTGRDPDNS